MSSGTKRFLCRYGCSSILRTNSSVTKTKGHLLRRHHAWPKPPDYANQTAWYSAYEAFGLAKCNVIRILQGLDADTGAWFDSLRNEISRNQMTVYSPLIPWLSDLYRITLLPVSSSVVVTTVVTKQSQQSMIPPSRPAWIDFINSFAFTLIVRKWRHH